MNDDNVQPIVAIPKDKQKIIALFLMNVKGRHSDTAKSNLKHAGKEGHWLEAAMGYKPNASNSPDILGYEMKNATTSKTTFGDWSGDYRIFKDSSYKITQDEFLGIFGKPNPSNDGRCSWSGEPCPKIGSYNRFGQQLIIDRDNNISALYNYSEDKRPDKKSVVPERFRKNNLILCRWSATLMRKRVENKFNQQGWFKCEKDKDGTYVSIVFGDPITFEKWIEAARSGLIFFDGGMYQGNNRPYSMWRANNKFWENLITSRY